MIDFLIDTVDATGSSQTTPTIAVLGNGNFVAVWRETALPGNNIGLRARIFDSSGAAVGDEFSVETSATNTQTTPQLAERLGVTTRTIERAIADMRKAGLIRRVGPAKGGKWEVLA